MRRTRRRNCLCCGELFRPDPRNHGRQKYCAKGTCRQASKAASQHHWLEKAQNHSYFCGPIHVERVRIWRAAHPGYWRRGGLGKPAPLQDPSFAQVFEEPRDSATLALQELWRSQPAVLVGLIAHLTDSRLQESILETSRRLLQLGQDILGARAAYADQTGVVPQAPATRSGAVQLGRPASGS